MPFLIVHGAIILFSTAALVTILVGEPPAWLDTDPAKTMYIYGWHFSGPAHVIVGALAALCHAAGKVGGRKALALLLVGFAISLGAELVGTSTGLPFGPYSYTPLLGYRLLGLVPFPIPLSWFYMLYCSLAMCGRIMEPDDSAGAKWRGAAVAGLIFTAWDVSLDPAMTKASSHWIWHVDGFFYGMPLLNWVGWWLTGTLVARAMLAVVGPVAFARTISPTRFPLVLYALNGIMPIALCLRHRLWWAGILGAIAMAIPLFLSSAGIIFPRWRSRSPRRAQPA
jgi:uncharacterized membrane protein